MDPITVNIVGQNEVSIKGNLSSLEDYTKIRDTINELVANGVKDICVDFIDSKTIMSSLLGFFMKLVNYDKVFVHIKVGSPELYKSLQTMHLLEIFDVKMR
ncbi:hypothetical protein [Calditerrivibrio sp.]|uniref:hypothetical protein n=1 Tax=Calditerrivibrio sp. TaxID=2792612 RepID=UPI003D0BDF13